MTFKETQRFSQFFIWISILAVGILTIGIFGVALYEQVIKGHRFGDHPVSNAALIWIFILNVILFICLVLLFRLTKLITIIDESGIYIKFFPFQLSFRRFAWDVIESYEVITYNPVKEYGGWGIRYGKKRKAYNVKRNKGLFIQFKNGKSLLVGTQQEGDLTRFLAEIH